MPDRIIRDEMLRSERYWAVSIEAQRFFIHLLLCVDDMARFSGKSYTLRAACFPGQAVDPAKVEKMLLELVDVDLLRIYHVGDERYIFVPRFKQRLRFRNSRYPDPPQEINDIDERKTDSSQTQVRLKSDSSLTQDGRSEEKRSEEKRSEVKKRKKPIRTSFVLPDWLLPHRDVWDAWIEARKAAKKPATEWAKSLAVVKLENLKEEGHNPRLLLAEAAYHGWADFYPKQKA